MASLNRLVRRGKENAPANDVPGYVQGIGGERVFEFCFELRIVYG